MGHRQPTRQELRDQRRYVIDEVGPDGGDGVIVGKRNGYKTFKEADAIAEAAAKAEPAKTFCVSIYSIFDGTRSHEETVEYYGQGLR